MPETYKKKTSYKRKSPSKNNYNNKKKKNIVLDHIQQVTEAVKHDVKYIAPNKYKKFVGSFKGENRKKMMKILPALLLALTILAIQNKRLIRPFFMAITKSIELFKTNDHSFIMKIYIVLKEYVKLLGSFGKIASLTMGFELVSLFLEGIPDVFRKVQPLGPWTPEVKVYTNILQNIEGLQKYVEKGDKPEEMSFLKRGIQEIKDLIVGKNTHGAELITRKSSTVTGRKKSLKRESDSDSDSDSD